MGALLKRASVARPSGEWSDDDFDVLADDALHLCGRAIAVTKPPPEPTCNNLGVGQCAAPVAARP
jgi:hypothetical protein